MVNRAPTQQRRNADDLRKLRQQARGEAHTSFAAVPASVPALEPVTLAAATAQAQARDGMDFSVFFFSAGGAATAGQAGDGLYQVELEIAKLADAAGFVAIWTPERHFENFGSAYPNPALLSTAIAMCTSRLQIRAGSVVVTLHHPIRVAEEWALVDNLSGGRVGIGLAKGWHQSDFVLDPAAYAERDAVFWRRINEIARLWRGEAVEFAGVDGKPQAVKTFPRPIQAELPMWVTISGLPETWIQAGSLGMNVMCSLTDRAELKANIERYRQARLAHGHALDTARVCVMLHSFVGADDDSVREVVREPLRAYLRTFLEQKINNQIARGIREKVSEQALQGLLDITFDDFFENKSLLGSTEKCARMVRELQADGVTEIACLVNFGLDAATIVSGFPYLTQLKNQFAATAAEQGGSACLQISN